MIGHDAVELVLDQLMRNPGPDDAGNPLTPERLATFRSFTRRAIVDPSWGPDWLHIWIDESLATN
jgi:hypothetical protein